MAARELPVGTLLGEEDLAQVDMAENEIRRSYVVADGPRAIEAFRGYAMRAAIPAGTPLTRSALLGPGQRGFLAAVLRPGTRAVTIGLSKGTRHAGLIDPGDRVDVILTAKLRLADGAKTVFTRTILEDVRVVAVDRRIETGVAEPESGRKVKRKEIVTATLEVSPAQADRLALGEHEGTLAVAVRSLASAAPRSQTKAVDLEQLLSTPAPEPDTKTVAKKAPASPRGARLAPWKKVRVFRGSEVSEVKFTDPGRTADRGPPPD